MWIFTKDGFFSVVFDKDCGREELMIRSRCREDLCRLSKKLYGYCDESQILELEHTDYRFRMKIKKHMWSDYLINCALSIDYANVKDNIIPTDDNLRKDTYYQIWIALYRWQASINSISI